MTCTLPNGTVIKDTDPDLIRYRSLLGTGKSFEQRQKEMGVPLDRFCSLVIASHWMHSREKQ